MNPTTLATTRPACACNCGEPLDPNGPSLFWASEGCHRRWLEQHHGAAPQVDYAGIAAMAQKVAVGIKSRLT